MGCKELGKSAPWYEVSGEDVKARKPRYKDFLTDLASGSKYGVFIDDTGSPGLQVKPSGQIIEQIRSLPAAKLPSFSSERKTWVGVIVPPIQMPEVLQQFPGVIKDLHKVTGAKEFHFSDIYAGSGDFKNVDLRIRLAFFKFMAEIFGRYRFPIFVQTFDPNTLSDIRMRGLGRFPDKVGPFNLKKQEDVALLFLLWRVKQYIEKHRSTSQTARVFVDEGYKRNGVAIYVPALEPVFADGLICFARSSLVYPIQLADFAAFALNRMTLLLGKEKIRSLDRQLLEILSPISWNYQNIPKRIIRIRESS